MKALLDGYTREQCLQLQFCNMPPSSHKLAPLGFLPQKCWFVLLLPLLCRLTKHKNHWKPIKHPRFNAPRVEAHTMHLRRRPSIHCLSVLNASGGTMYQALVCLALYNNTQPPMLWTEAMLFQTLCPVSQNWHHKNGHCICNDACCDVTAASSEISQGDHGLHAPCSGSCHNPSIQLPYQPTHLVTDLLATPYQRLGNRECPLGSLWLEQRHIETYPWGACGGSHGKRSATKSKRAETLLYERETCAKKQPMSGFCTEEVN